MGFRTESMETNEPAPTQSQGPTRDMLEAAVRAVCGTTIKTDGKSDRELRLMVAALQAPGINLHTKSDAYVEVLFDMAVSKVTKSDAKATVAAKDDAKVEQPAPKPPKTFGQVADELFRSAGKRAPVAEAKSNPTLNDRLKEAPTVPLPEYVNPVKAPKNFIEAAQEVFKSAGKRAPAGEAGDGEMPQSPSMQPTTTFGPTAKGRKP